MNRLNRLLATGTLAVAITLAGYSGVLNSMKNNADKYFAVRNYQAKRTALVKRIDDGIQDVKYVGSDDVTYAGRRRYREEFSGENKEFTIFVRRDFDHPEHTLFSEVLVIYSPTKGIVSAGICSDPSRIDPKKGDSVSFLLEDYKNLIGSGTDPLDFYQKGTPGSERVFQSIQHILDEIKDARRSGTSKRISESAAERETQLHGMLDQTANYRELKQYR
ncbi:MAG: hypothetical protein HY831_05215 [Candidatus Aenigmarchaeota archaeon]|nr:hypothetical protein [Candidatus Aenigmarchaeota archaeon]